MKHTKQILLFLFSLFLFCNNSFSMQEQQSNFNLDEPFTRLHDEQIQLASKTYATKLGGKITFLSAVHFADAEFYEAHQKILDLADYVLFEGKGLDKEGLEFNKTELGKNMYLLDNNNNLIAHAFGLQYQYDSINYNKNNFILADFSFKENIKLCFNDISEMISEGEKMINSIKNKYSTEADPIKFYYNQKIEQLRKRDFSSFFNEFKEGLLLNENEFKNKIDPEFYEIELVRRNSIVMDKLQDLINQNPSKHILIHYGAAHFPSLERDIHNIYELTPLCQEWLSAIKNR